MPSERIIKKYPNRRLYDMAASRYITLAEVKEMVMGDVPFKVQDSQTERDITRNILLQIILEQESGGGQPMFTSDVLARFIRFYGDPAQATLSSFIEQGLDYLIQQQRRLSEQTNAAWSANPIEFWSKLGEQNMALWKQMGTYFQHAPDDGSDTEEQP